MAVDLARFTQMDETMAIQEAATAGLQSMEHLIRILSHQNQTHSQQNRSPDCRQLTDFTVSKFKQALNRSGHARFRRGPSNPPPSRPDPPAVSRQAQTLTLDFAKPVLIKPTPNPNPSDLRTSQSSKECFSMSNNQISSSNSSFLSSITGDGSVSNGKQGSPIQTMTAPAFSAGKPPLSSSHRKRCKEHGDELAGKSSMSTGSACHCSKKRKLRMKNTIRVPAISSKVADIPADEHSWRKYGQKPIKDSPYPRGYYKCSTVRGCPARKHVERAKDDPTMLIVTYDGEHRHSSTPAPETVPAGGVTLVFR